MATLSNPPAEIAAGNTAEAVKAYQQDLEISRKLAENDPDSYPGKFSRQ